MDACKYSEQPVIASRTGVEKVFFHNRCKSDAPDQVDRTCLQEACGPKSVFTKMVFGPSRLLAPSRI